MKITIDTVNKIIEIESATTEELKQLCKDYKGYTVQSKMVQNWSYPWISIPHIQTEPYFYDWPITLGTLTTNQ